MKRQIKVIGPAKFYCKDEIITIVEDFELFDLSKVIPMEILQNNLQSNVLSHGKFYGLDDPWFQDDKLMLEFSPGNVRNADVEYDVKQIKSTYSTYQILKGIKYNIHTEDNKP